MASAIFKVTFDDGFNCDSCASGVGPLCHATTPVSWNVFLPSRINFVDVDVIGGVVSLERLGGTTAQLSLFIDCSVYSASGVSIFSTFL
jgi:hypothetical protein